MEELETKNNSQIYGFYDSVGLDLDEASMLQVIYLIDGKYYVMFRDEDVLSGIIFKLDMISDMYKKDKDKMYYAVSEFMSHFEAAVTSKEKYKLFEIDIKNVHNLIRFDKDKVLIADDFKITDSCYNGALVLANGYIAVGDKFFLERVILDNVEDKIQRLELLEEIYYNFCDFEKREKVINDFCDMFYDTLDELHREMWDDKRMNNYLILYALSLLGPLNVDFREVKNVEAIEETKVLS